jgi:hypothetical protein
MDHLMLRREIERVSIYFSNHKIYTIITSDTKIIKIHVNLLKEPFKTKH